MSCGYFARACFLILVSAATIFAQTQPPRIRFKVEPEYTRKALRKKLQGLIVVDLTVDTEGNPKDIHVVRSLGMGLDEKAVEAVKKWVFFPATKDGTPVDSPITVDVSFKLAEK
jgi:protein TonB